MVLRRGVLIAVEGIDGAGKTTQVGLLHEHLERIGIESVRTKEPTNGSFGRRLRESALHGRLSADEELETFIKDRKEHVERVIRPALDQGKVVIVDRYYFSTAAYQGARGYDPDDIIARNEAFAPHPDMLFLLAIDPRTAIDRIHERGGVANEFEKVEYLAQCGAVFERLDRPFVVKMDGTANMEVIHERILREIDRGPIFRATCFKDYLQECEPEYCSYRISGECKYPSLDLARPSANVSIKLLNEIARSTSLTVQEKLDMTIRAFGEDKPQSG